MKKQAARCSRILGTLAMICLSGCVNWQSAMDAHGPYAARLASMTLVFSVILGGIWLLVVIAMTFALLRRRALFERLDPAATDERGERLSLRVILGLAITTGVIVLILTGVSFIGQRDLFAAQPNNLVIQVTGHQWWWEVRYQDQTPSHIFTTANEMHMPVGIPVKVQLQSQDVIHSFWVPSLNGKKDLIPGQPNEIELIASRPGVYRGQCAEFCGIQHAHMSFLVVAEDQASFDRWLENQRSSATQPETPDQKRGEDIFMSSACVMCHTIGGTQAGGRAGPDLTHVGSRSMIAAGQFPLNSGTLAAWIADPQGLKPGSQMPAVSLSADELNAVTAYLQGLK
jgi:cytochrome c oxidase subunit II